MYLETRGDKKYAYRTVREGKTVKKIYLGRGANAQQLMLMQELSREKVLIQDRAEAEEQAKLWPLQQRMGLIRAEAKKGLEAMYLATGHYRSKCRHWRRSKMYTVQSPDSTDHQSAQVPELTKDREAQLKRNDLLQSLCDQIKAGNPSLRAKLRKLLREEDPEVLRRFSDLTELVADRWASQIAPNNEVARASIVLDAMDQWRALAPPGRTPVEQILAGRVVLSSLQQTYHEIRITAIVSDADVIGTKIGNAMEKRLQVSTRELADATKNYQKGIELAAEISPPRPQAGVAALKIFNPDSKRKSA